MNPQTSAYGMSIPPLEQITVSVRLPDYRFHELIGKEVDGLISCEELGELDELFRQKELGDAASGPGSCPSDRTPSGFAAPRCDPYREGEQ